MRETIIHFFNQTIVMKYTLPHGGVDKSVWTTLDNDYCFSHSTDEDVAKIIYESIVNYAFNDDEIAAEEDLNILQREAIASRLRFEESDENPTKERYGFYGEVLFNTLLRAKCRTTPIIAKGFFYDPLRPGENYGYDSFHIVKTANVTRLWFGEVKFHQSYQSAVDSVFEKIGEALSNDYLRTNLLAIVPKKHDLNIDDETVNGLINRLRRNPKVSIASLYEEFQLRLIYPVFIICNSLREYDTTIAHMINYINQQTIERQDLDIPVDVFFMFLPIGDAKKIKQTVIEWIESNQQPTLL